MKVEIGLDPFKLVGQPLKQYGFGLNKEATAKALRDFVDDLDKSHILLQKLSLTKTVDYEDYQLNTLTLEFVTKRDTEKENKNG